MRRAKRWVGVCAVVVAACAFACTHGSSVAPTDSTSPRASASCPAAIVAQSPSGQPIIIGFEDPRVANVTQPITVACAPASGSSFPVGTTTVACTITDARQQTSSCSFTIKVVGPPRLSAANFLAFGDSLTGGTTPPDPPDSYPPRLRAQLVARYVGQTIVVTNDGRAGENASATGRTRLPVALDAFRPNVLLLMEGSNDLLGGSAGATAALSALTEMVRTARGRGIIVFLATLPPQRLGGVRDAVARMIPAFNEDIKSLAPREGATLVDIYTAMGGDGRYIGRDDLHPTPEGFEVMARTFAAAIVDRLEIPQ